MSRVVQTPVLLHSNSSGVRLRYDLQSVNLSYWLLGRQQQATQGSFPGEQGRPEQSWPSMAVPPLPQGALPGVPGSTPAW